ncbi:MAG: CsbD family protein [Anaerolineaceae bacterium]
MNKYIIQGNWKETQGKFKEWWGKLTDDDLTQSEGNAEQIIGLIQKKYGYTRDHAEEEFNLRIKGIKDVVNEF